MSSPDLPPDAPPGSPTSGDSGRRWLRRKEAGPSLEELEARIDEAIETAEPVTLAALRARPYPIRLIDRLIWLGSPYL